MLLVADAGAMPIADASIDLILTSPPYNANILYDDYNDDLPWEEYWERAAVWAIEMFRISCPGGHAVINMSLDVRRKNHQRPKPSAKRERVHNLCLHWIDKMQEAGFEYRGMHIWFKAESEDKFFRHSPRIGTYDTPAILNSGEGVFVFLNPEKSLLRRPNEVKKEYENNRQLMVMDAANIWFLPFTSEATDRKWHPCPWPRELAEKAIRLYSRQGDVVLDPFAGSAIVPATANDMGRAGIGFDLSIATIQRCMGEDTVCKIEPTKKPKQGGLF